MSNLYIIKKADDCTITNKDQDYLSWRQFVEVCSEIAPGDYVSEFGFIEGARDALVIRKFARMIMDSDVIEAEERGEEI